MVARSKTETALVLDATGLTIEEAGEYLGVPKRSLEGYVRGARTTPTDVLDRLKDLVVRVHHPGVVLEKLPAGATIRRDTINMCRVRRANRGEE